MKLTWQAGGEARVPGLLECARMKRPLPEPHIVPTQHPLAPPATPSRHRPGVPSGCPAGRASVRYWAGVSVGKHTWAGVLVSFQGCSELLGGSLAFS